MRMITFIAENSFRFKFNHRISEELYEGHLHFSFDPHGPPTNVVFVKVAQDDAETIFQRTAAANDGVVLRPWTYLFSKQKEFEDLPEDTDLRKGIWVLCYDRFEHNLKHWTNLAKPKPKGIAYNDKLKLPIKTGDDRLNEFWCNSIRKLIDGVCDIQKEGLYHGGLGSRSNYIINIKGSLDKLTDEQCEARKKEDIMDLLWMLDNWFESIIAGGKRSWPECQHFFDFVNHAKTLNLGCDVFVKKVLHHPFLLNADQRMRLFDHYDTMRNCPITAELSTTLWHYPLLIISYPGTLLQPELIEAIAHIHDCGLFHGSLSDYYNYVVVGDQVKLFNIGGCLKGLSVDNQHSKKIQDFKDFRDFLKKLMPARSPKWNERDSFIKCFDEKADRYSDHAFAAGGTLSGSGSVGLLCSVGFRTWHPALGRLCKIFGRKSRFLISGPGIGEMSVTRRDSLRDRYGWGVPGAVAVAVPAAEVFYGRLDSSSKGVYLHEDEFKINFFRKKLSDDQPPYVLCQGKSIYCNESNTVFIKFNMYQSSGNIRSI
ncbi:hypothetical protein Prudu_730S000200 [Prunus dulcis]|uniref:Uncharacterized protein n=1 Tax=Prunus dulcis TaxID=3755 RepID=A0A5H2XZS2_PRUDU|nr:hypothetical protein Prudu_730S000200 [Prunus dulcis]